MNDFKAIVGIKITCESNIEMLKTVDQLMFNMYKSKKFDLNNIRGLVCLSESFNGECPFQFNRVNENQYDITFLIDIDGSIYNKF